MSCVLCLLLIESKDEFRVDFNMRIRLKCVLTYIKRSVQYKHMDMLAAEVNLVFTRLGLES